MDLISTSTIRKVFKTRKSDSNKSNFGHVLLIAGNTGKMGAALICGKACLRSGVGLLTINVPFEEREIIQVGLPEAMLVFRNVNFEKEPFSAIGIGPGLGVSVESNEMLEDLFANSTKPLVLDADALTLLSRNKTLQSTLPLNTILTPHQGEFDRLFGPHENQAQRLETAVKKAKAWQCVFVMKGEKTCVVSPNDMVQNTTGNAGLAKGGSGDALTGMICAFLAQGYESFVAAQLGVYFHGLAADLALKNQSVESLLITDVIDRIGDAFKTIETEELN